MLTTLLALFFFNPAAYALDLRCETVRPFLADSEGRPAVLVVNASISGANSIGDIRATIGGEAVKLSERSASGVTLAGGQGISYRLGRLSDLSNTLSLVLPIPAGEVKHKIAAEFRETNPNDRVGAICNVGFSAF